MKLTVNGAPHQHNGSGTVKALIEELGANPNHAAIMLNGSVVPSDQWETTPLNEGNELEVLVFVGGG